VLLQVEYVADIRPDTRLRALECNEQARACIEKPMEMQRGRGSAEKLIECFSALKSAIDHVPISFIWHMDQIGDSD
jgi:hypothetical protein